MQQFQEKNPRSVNAEQVESMTTYTANGWIDMTNAFVLEFIPGPGDWVIFDEEGNPQKTMNDNEFQATYESVGPKQDKPSEGGKRIKK